MLLLALVSAAGVLLLTALVATLRALRRARHARRNRPAVVLAMAESSGGGAGATVVVDQSSLSSVELAEVDVAGTTTSPAKRGEAPSSRLIDKDAKQEA